MNLQLLETFLTVAELNNFTKAAEKLHISQPTVSWQIKELEQILKVSLFERDGKKIEVSEAGMKFMPLARNMLLEWNKTVDLMADSADIPENVRIGCPEVLALSHVSDIVKVLNKNVKNFSAEVVVDVFSNLLGRLLRNELDLIYLLNKQMTVENFEKLVEKEEKIVFVCAPEHPLGREKNISKRLEEFTFIIPYRDEVTSYVYEAQEYFGRYNIRIPSILKVGSVVMIKELAAANTGVALLPHCFVKKEIEQGKLVQLPMENLDITMWHQVFCLKDKKMTGAKKLFLDELSKVLQ